MKSGHHIRWLLAALAFGAAVLPILVYATGARILGPYSDGGPGSFYANFVTDLLHLRPAAWTLAAGPAALVLVWRLHAAYARSDDGQ